MSVAQVVDQKQKPSKAKPDAKQQVVYENAGSTLLAMQPSETDKKPKGNPLEWGALRSHLESRLVGLRQWRNSWWTQNWSNLSQYILPRRSIWLTQSTGGLPSPNNMTRGRQINNSILDPTATFATRVCAAGLMSGLASASRPWFKVTTSLKNFQPDEAGRQWMDEVENRLYTILAGSNFYNAFAQECEDLVVFGTAPSIIYEDAKDLIRCYNPVVGEYYLAADATLRVDGLFRQFVMTVSQMVSFFGLENCPEEIQGLWKQKGNGIDTERIIAHSIEPNYEVTGCPKIPGNFTWREVYWVYGASSKYPLSKRGFVDCPFSAARWATQSNDAYGRSVGMDVLPDVIQLQVETGRKAEGIEKGLRPPLIADISMKNQPSSILPGHVTYVQNLGPGSGMRSIYEVNFDLEHVSADIAQIQQRIKVGLFNDLFLMLSENPTQKQTAYETAAKIQEKLQVLGPVIENIITESLKPKLKRIYGIVTRKGMMPPMPDSMKNIPLDVEFISMLALAQKASNTGGLERLAALIGNMVAVYPEVRDILNPDLFIRQFNDLLNNTESVLRDPKEVAKMRAAQAQKQAAAEKMAAAQHMATTAQIGSQAAVNMANTQIGGGQQALSAMLSGQQQAG
jgi:hypothetical protein